MSRPVRIYLSIARIREMVGCTYNGYDKHRGLEPEDAKIRKTFKGCGDKCAGGFYHFNGKRSGFAKF